VGQEHPPRRLLEAGTADPEIAKWCDVHERRRRQTVTEAIELSLQRAVEPAASTDGSGVEDDQRGDPD
jgi:hypothetical protein